MYLVILLKLISLFSCSVSSDWGDINHAISLLEVISSLYWYLQFLNVIQAKMFEFIIHLLSNFLLN